MDIGGAIIVAAMIGGGDPPPSVLIVSASRITRVVLAGIVEKMGLRASCLSVEEAAAAATARPPLALLVDCERSRDSGLGPRELVAIFTALVPRPMLVAVAPKVPDPSLAAQFDRIVARPIVPFDVEQAIGGLLDIRRPR